MVLQRDVPNKIWGYGKLTSSQVKKKLLTSSLAESKGLFWNPRGKKKIFVFCTRQKKNTCFVSFFVADHLKIKPIF